MTTQEWERVKELVATALEHDAAARQLYLSQLEQDEPWVAAQVAELVLSHDKAGDFLGRPLVLDCDFLDDLEADQRFTPGELISGRFEIVRLIAKGGMGEVYEAWDREIEDHVALKTLRFEVSTHEGFTARFRKEIQLARKVTHPNVCRIFESFKHQLGHTGYISVLSMELLHGPTLAEYLAAKGKLTVADAEPIAQQIIAGLQAVHEAGIIHRDLKPSNLVLVPDGDGFRVKITDFGIAGRLPDDPSQAPVTQASKMLGTPDYMAPEQLELGQATIRSDIYALGLVLYEMVTGTKPFAGSAWKRLSHRPASPRRLSTEVTPSWDRTILSCLARNPDLRPCAISSVLTMLATPPPRTWPVKMALAIAFSIALVFLILHFRPQSRNPEAQIAVDAARVALDTQSQSGFVTAIERYQRAIALEPQWAQPWAELAYTYASASNSRYLDSRKAAYEAHQAALAAIRLDPKSPKAKAVLAWTQSLDFDEWPAAERTFREALSDAPEDGQLHYWFGVHLRKKGNFREAEEQDLLALRLTHQRDVNVWCELAFLYWTSEQQDKLRSHLQELLRMFPNFPTTRYLHARQLKLDGSFEEAANELSFAEKLGLNPLTVLAERASLEEYRGNTAEARRDIALIEKASLTSEIDGLLLAGDYAGIQDNDAAFRVLEAAFDKKDNTLLSLATSPIMKPLRRDPRYTSLLKRLHFTDQIMQQIGFN